MDDGGFFAGMGKVALPHRRQQELPMGRFILTIRFVAG